MVKIKVKNLRRSEQNSPLQIAYQILYDYIEASRFFDQLIDSVEFFRFSRREARRLKRRDKLLLAYFKIVNAIKALTVVLRRPPTIAEVAEASGENRQRVGRLVRGNYKLIGQEAMPFGYSLNSCSSRGYTILRDKRGNKIILPKKLGRPSMESIYKGDKCAGRPCKIVEIFEKTSNLELYWQKLSPYERNQLETYLKSKIVVDAVKELYIKFFSFVHLIIRYREDVEKFVIDFMKPIGEKVLKIAERYPYVHLTPQVRSFLTFDWILQYPEPFSLEDINKFVEFIRTMPDDEFASHLIISLFKN
ncbi:MAG: hypothetical protein QW175_05830 [Candidatus Bathyarchaeia archaeon]